MADSRRGLHSYTVQEAQNASMGQAGSLYHGGTDTLAAPTGTVFVAIQFVTDTVFNSTSGLVAQDDDFWPHTQTTGSVIDSDADPVDSVTFPAGMTIYGRWTQVILASGSVILYVG